MKASFDCGLHAPLVSGLPLYDFESFSSTAISFQFFFFFLLYFSFIEILNKTPNTKPLSRR